MVNCTKPMIFNTKMVQAILEDRKTVTRRVLKPQPEGRPVPMTKDSCWPGYFAIPGTAKVVRRPYQPGDILWVRETWNCLPIPEPLRGTSKTYWYKADGAEPRDKWRSPNHMPLEAARIFLRVTGVRVERLRDMVLGDVLMEGITEADTYESTWDRWHQAWNSTIEPKDLGSYGWEANPWVWVISFERIEKPADWETQGGKDG